MRLTKKKAIEISIELWTWLAETGAETKWEWIGWEWYGEMQDDCPFCEYSHEREGCAGCPIEKQYGGCYATAFNSWRGRETTKKSRKKYATLFLEQLKELK